MVRVLTYLQRQFNDKLCEEIGCHLDQLRTESTHYFRTSYCAYITNLFPVNPSLLPVGRREQENIRDI